MNGATDKLEYSPLPRQCQEEPVPSPDSDTDEFHDFDEEWEQYLAIIIRQEESGIMILKIDSRYLFFIN